MQSSLGDCYFFAALAEVARQPEIIRDDIFQTQTISDTYTIRVFIRGRPWLITVDDEFLFLKEIDNLRFGYYLEQGLWVPILEKALAKISGNYNELEYGYTVNSIQLLTGAPVFSYKLKEYISLYKLRNLLKEASSQNYTITAGNSGIDDTTLNDCGIHNHHAFSILSVFEMNSSDGTSQELMMIRNPRMVTEYKGKWNTADYESWTPELRAQVPFSIDPLKHQDEGLMFLSIESFH